MAPACARLASPHRGVPLCSGVRHALRNLAGFDECRLGQGDLSAPVRRCTPVSAATRPTRAAPERLSQLTRLRYRAYTFFRYGKQLGINSQFEAHYLLTRKTFLTNNSWAVYAL